MSDARAASNGILAREATEADSASRRVQSELASAAFGAEEWAEAEAAAPQVLDGDDAIEHGRWQGQYLDFAMGTIGGGTCEVHRNGIGERVLGRPREPRSDRDAAFRDLKV